MYFQLDLTRFFDVCSGWYSSNGACYWGEQYTPTYDDDGGSVGPKHNEKIYHEDVLGISVDRATGELRFYKNGRAQRMGAQAECLKTEVRFTAAYLSVGAVNAYIAA